MSDRDKNPLESDPLYDPFHPEVVRITMSDGTHPIDIIATAMERGKAMLPTLSTDLLQVDDVLSIEFDDGTQRNLKVKSSKVGSLTFGSDEILRPAIAVEDSGKDNAEQFYLIGSSVLPNGKLIQSGAISVGEFLLTSENSPIKEISSFNLKRPDEDGTLKEVSLNSINLPEASGSYSNAVESFKKIEEMLDEDGFTFDQVDKGEYAFSKRYMKHDQHSLIYACRQGFGSKVHPQDEVYVYDAKDRVLRGIRNIPEKGIIQAVIIKATPEQFAEATSRGNWQNPLGISAPVLHRLSHNSPFITYSWRNPGEKQPVIAIKVDGA